MRLFLPALLTLLLSTLTLAFYAADLEVAQVYQIIQAYPKKSLIVGQVERRQGNAGPLESTLSGASSTYRSPTYAFPSPTSSADSSSVSAATTAVASGTTVGVEQGAGAKAPSTAARQETSTSSSKGGAPMATGHWAAAGILAAGMGGLMI